MWVVTTSRVSLPLTRRSETLASNPSPSPVTATRQSPHGAGGGGDVLIAGLWHGKGWWAAVTCAPGMRGRAAAVLDWWFSPAALAVPVVSGGPQIHCDGDLRRRPGLARLMEMRTSEHGPGWRRARPHARIRHAAAWVTWFRFTLDSLYVWFGTARRRRCPSVGIMSSPPYPVGVLITCGGHGEVCLRQVFRDLASFGLRWIRLDLTGTRGLWSFYRPFSAFSSPGRRLASQIAVVGVSWSTLTTSRSLLLEALGLNKFARSRWRPRGGIELCSWRAAGGCRGKKTSTHPRIWM